MESVLADIAHQRLSPEDAEAYAATVRQYLLTQAAEVVGRCQFMQQLQAGQLSSQALKCFWLNWHSQVWEINNLIAVGYHRFTPFFKRNLDLLPHYAEKIADELTHPKPPGHLLIVWQQGELFGLTREEMVDYPVIPECRGLMEWHRGLLGEGTMIEYWAAMLYEEYTGYWSRAFGRALIDHYGYTPSQIVYFKTHEEADLTEHDGVMGHGEFNWTVFRRMLEQGETAFRPGVSIQYCVDTELALRRNFLDRCAQA